MEWEILISFASILVTILIFSITSFDRRVKRVSAKVDVDHDKIDIRVREVEGSMIEARTENKQIIKRLDRIETKIDDLGQSMRK